MYIQGYTTKTTAPRVLFWNPERGGMLKPSKNNSLSRTEIAPHWFVFRSHLFRSVVSFSPFVAYRYIWRSSYFGLRRLTHSPNFGSSAMPSPSYGWDSSCVHLTTINFHKGEKGCEHTLLAIYCPPCRGWLAATAAVVNIDIVLLSFFVWVFFLFKWHPSCPSSLPVIQALLIPDDCASTRGHLALRFSQKEKVVADLKRRD